MKLIDMTCPRCSASMKVDVDTENKFVTCEYCGSIIMIDNEVQHIQFDQAEDAGYRFEKGRQRAQAEATREIQSNPVTIVNNYTVANPSPNNIAIPYKGQAKNKWTAFFLCLFLGCFGAHKFYEGKTGRGILYLFTFGLFGIGWMIDSLVLLFKRNPYYVK